MSVLFFNPQIFDTNREILIDKLTKEISQSTFESYDMNFINNLFLIINGYDGYYASSLAHELLNKYIIWVEIKEKNILRKIKSNVNYYLSSMFIKLNIKYNNDLLTLDKILISSDELKNRLNIIRNELKIFDVCNRSPFDIKKYIHSIVLNKNINKSLVMSDLSFDPFDDELETIIID
jgi:hypothetical protein